jgi:hypothetical protein
MPSVKVEAKFFSCPEEERPSNIGPYEVPTQKDLVLHVKTRLRKLLASYHAKALFFLKDIKQVNSGKPSSQARHKFFILQSTPHQALHFGLCFALISKTLALISNSMYNLTCC